MLKRLVIKIEEDSQFFLKPENTASTSSFASFFFNALTKIETVAFKSNLLIKIPGSMRCLDS